MASVRLIIHKYNNAGDFCAIWFSRVFVLQSLYWDDLTTAQHIPTILISRHFVCLPFRLITYFSIVRRWFCHLYTLRNRINNSTFYIIYCPLNGSTGWSNNRTARTEKFWAKIAQAIDLVDCAGCIFGLHAICNRLQSPEHLHRTKIGRKWRSIQRAATASIWYLMSKWTLYTCLSNTKMFSEFFLWKKLDQTGLLNSCPLSSSGAAS